MKLYLSYSLLLVMSLFLSSCAIVPLKTIKEDKNALKNSAEQGYLLLAINTDVRISSVELKSDSSFTLNDFVWLNDRNYFFAPLPKEQYTLTKINLFYNGYYELDFDDVSFSFNIAPNQINYGGELRIKRGYGGSASFELINRSSLALEFLEAKYPNILSEKQVIYQGPGNDDFFGLVLNSTSPPVLESEQ